MHFCQRRWDYKCYKCAGFRYGKGEIMGKFAVKIERVITIALILSMMLILIPGVSVQAKAKKCNHKHTGRTWIIAEKATCTNRGLKYKKCKSCGKKWTDVIRRTPALGHKPGKVKILKPGCTSVGYKTTNCTRKGCMNSYGGAEDGYLTVETIPALGHSYDKGTSIKIGKKRGGKMKYQKTQKCKRCGKRKISYYYK